MKYTTHKLCKLSLKFPEQNVVYQCQTQTSGVILQEGKVTGDIELLCVSYRYSVLFIYKHNRTDLIYWPFIQHYYTFRLSTRCIPDVDNGE